METSPLKIKTAVPVEVQRVLDAMTEENWRRDADVTFDGKACFLNRAAIIEHGAEYVDTYHTRHLFDEGYNGTSYDGAWDEIIAENAIFADLQGRCVAKYHCGLWQLNDDESASLSDFKSKIIALYETGSEK